MAASQKEEYSAIVILVISYKPPYAKFCLFCVAGLIIIVGTRLRFIKGRMNIDEYQLTSVVNLKLMDTVGLRRNHDLKGFCEQFKYINKYVIVILSSIAYSNIF